jgi:hypothetical protein
MKSLIPLILLSPGFLPGQALDVPWAGYAHDAQHTAVSATAAQGLNGIHWSTPVDLNPPATSGDLYIHYGSAAVTAANTVLVPVKTGATDGFEVQAFSGSSGALLYTLQTDYALPPHDWTPPYGLALSVRLAGALPERDPALRSRSPVPGPKLIERLYYPGAGGTVYYRDQVDFPTGPSGQIAFFGNQLYAANQVVLNNEVQISTPLTADTLGNVFFGFIAQGSNPANLVSGIARISRDGTGSWMSAQAFSGGDRAIAQVAANCAPALSNDQKTIYFAVSTGGESGTGYLASADSATLAPKAVIALTDPRGGLATVSSDSSASPAVGPDGDVYFGVLETPCCDSHNDRGWLLHFDAALTRIKTPGSFGWDDTASIVAANLVPSYTGSSAYLVLTKYNNYAGTGSGNGVNQLAVLDPNGEQRDEYSATAVTVMKEVLTIAGVTPDPQSGFPNAVREWCINTAAIDPFSRSAMVNSEDGVLYRWDFTTNTFTQRVRLTSGRGEAYTPTVIAADGTVFAINDAILFAVGQ